MQSQNVMGQGSTLIYSSLSCLLISFGFAKYITLEFIGVLLRIFQY